MSEEKQTKNCPYCGEEILATAKKCKHCGEWLGESESVLTDEEIERFAEDAANAAIAEMEKADEKVNKLWKIIRTCINVASVLIVAGVLSLFLFTVPDEQEHIAEVNKYADKASSLVIRDLKQIAENKFPLYPAFDVISEELCAEVRKVIREGCLHHFKYTNCLLFSVGDLDGETTQIGFLGFVLDFTDMDESEIHDIAADIWKNLVLAEFLDYLD